jgi:uncharacterized protein (DUF1697 family)
MQECISFLRSVNMAGHNLIKMTELSKVFVDLGFPDAKTYIQSGNVIFSNPEKIPSASLSLQIEKAVKERFSLNISVMTRTVDELNSLFEVNPYLREPQFDPSKMAVIFLHEKVRADQITRVEGISYPPDMFTISGSEIFIYCPNGFGKTKLYTGFFEKKMGVIGTARNWKTVTTLLNMIV